MGQSLILFLLLTLFVCRSNTAVFGELILLDGTPFLMQLTLFITGMIKVHFWDDHYGAPPDNDDPEDITNLSPGTYSITISVTADGINFCTYDSTITINQNPQLTLSVIDDTLNCYGQNTGTVTALPTGGYTPYSYNWTNIDPNPLGDMQQKLA